MTLALSHLFVEMEPHPSLPLPQLQRVLPVVTADTTTLSYWLNWRVLLCATWLLTSVMISLVIIWKYESLHRSKSERGEAQPGIAQFLRNDETWRPCLEEIDPIWLLAFRVTAFCMLLATLIIKIVRSGGVMLYYYSQWTLTLLTIYFGFGSMLSIYGCYRYHKRSGRGNVHNVEIDAEHGPRVPLIKEERKNMYRVEKASNSPDEVYASRATDLWSYFFQVIFQMSAGAVMLTDCIYWLIIFPFLTLRDYDLNFMTVNVHSLNAALFVVDTFLNSLPFPWFRISYFILWTGVYVIFQWAIHACFSIWWPYPFLDLSSTYAPLWYLMVGLMHIPCYGVFALIVQAKHYMLSRWFPESYRWSM